MVILADSLSRETTTTKAVLATIENASRQCPTGSLSKWLKRPGLDSDLPKK
jgi:hypothetical protein